jgi:hypothetical protein
VEATQPLTAARSCRKTGIFGQPVSEGVAAMSPTSFPFRRDFLRYVGSGLFAMQARHKFPACRRQPNRIAAAQNLAIYRRRSGPN